MQGLGGSHFNLAEKGWWHLLIAAASLRIQGGNVSKNTAGRIENHIQCDTSLLILTALGKFM